jgi:putative peptide zinc metalloprotease protein
LVLQNETLERESVAIETEHQVLSTKLQALQLRRAGRPEVSAQIPAITAAIDAVAQRLRWHRERLQRLTISAPKDGVVYAPPRRRADPQIGSGDEVDGGWTQPWTGAPPWTGTPLDAANRHATIPEGTAVAWVGHADRREAVLVVPQSDVAAVRRGQRVELLRGGFGDTRVTGTVSEIASMAAGSGSPAGEASDRVYQAICRIDPTQSALPVRSTGYAKIEVAPMSLHARVVRSVRQAFVVP